MRTVPYNLNSTLYQTLKAQRTGANARATMQATATTYKSTAAYVPTVTDLYAQFPGFQLVDDYLRTKQKEAVLADLKTLVEGPSVLNKTAAAYIGAGTYGPLKSKVWDNLMVQCILGENTALRTELTRILRLLNIIERIAANDPVLITGTGIFGLYMATVLVPGDVFPLPDVPLPTEPETRPLPTDPTAGLQAQLQVLQDAYATVKTAYEQQTYEYKQRRYPARSETDPDDSKQANLLKHDPLALDPARAAALNAPTRTSLGQFGISLNFVYMPRVDEAYGAEIRRLGRLVNASKERTMVARVGSSLISMGNECVNATLEPPCKPFTFVQWPGGAGHIRPIGMADLKVVQTQLYKYEQGEVAHVENILRGEKRTRTFRDLYHQESTLEEEQETTTENEHDTRTTERFELQQEASNVVQQDQASQVGVSASISYGPMGSGSLSAGTSSSTSQLQANSLATTYAKDVTDRALQRVVEHTRTRRSVTTIVENEDTTEHSFDNTAEGAGGTENIAGVYRWLDKVYYNKVVNYGRRMMFEFIVPEPAAFFLFSKLAKAQGDEVMEVPPPFDITSFEQITPDTYDGYAALYGATGVKPPPQGLVSVQATKGHDYVGSGDVTWTTWVTQLTVPEGHTATSARVSILLSSGSDHYITVCVGTSAPVTRYVSEVVDITDIPATAGDVPINMRCHSDHFALAVELFCAPSAKTYQQWQIDTYAALKTAYDQKVNDYNRWLNQQSYWAAQYGTNPELNRQTERKELKKYCIEFISGQRFESFDALRNNVAPYGYPEFSFSEASAEGRYIQFFEQGFEWEQMTYWFYPYYWARKKEWVNILKRDESDPLFMNFLQAGAARVLVPVRPGYEKTILHYLSTGGEIWNGEDVPAPNDPLYVSIIDEVQEANGDFVGGVIEGEPWLSKVPTSLVYLEHQGSPSDLPDYSADLPL
ncbi:MAG: hypothetical protein KBF80_14305 [Flavobacteriales bacterium]|nr:hypothetical protein [Flavobacteriales bacterium]